MTRVDHLTVEEQFALLLDGELRPQDTGVEVRSLYALVQTVEDHTSLARPEPAFRAGLRERLVVAAADAHVSAWDRVRDAVWMRTASVRNSVRAALASGVAASMIGTAGVAAAAQHALPGELLYPVKELTESVRLGLAGDLAASGRLQLRFARERLEEVDGGAQRLPPQLLIDTLEEMDQRSIDGAENLLAWAARTGDDGVVAELEEFTAEQRDGLQRVIDELPAAVVPFAERSLEVLRRIDVEIAGEPEPCDCPSDPATVPPAVAQEPVVSTPGEDPAGTPSRPCDCTPPSDREPAPREPQPRDEPEPRDEEPPAPDEPSPSDEPVDLVPELPSPLDPVGDTLDELVNDVLDETDPVTEPLPVDPEDDVVEPVDGTVDELIGGVP